MPTARAAAALALALPIALASGGAGAARAGAGGILLVKIGPDFVFPTYVAQPPGERERLYVVERRGRVVVLEGDRVQAQPFLDIRPSVSTNGLQGMFSIAFHPRYARNGRFYVHYTGQGGGINVVEFRTRAGRAVRSSRRVLLHVPRPGPGVGGHYGGQLAFDRNGRLYASIGDGGGAGDPGEHAQDLTSPLGKLFRIDVDRPGAEPKIVGYGLRNPWRFSFDRTAGDLYLGDVGERRWEEIDFVPRGRLDLVNFGWDAYEGRARFEPERPDPSGRLAFPIVQYRHGPGGAGASVTGGFVYRGAALPAERGRYFYGDLSTGRVWSFTTARGKAIEHRRERFLVPGIVSFGEDSRGELYLISVAGGVYRMDSR